jgi:hypothetical protein
VLLARDETDDDVDERRNDVRSLWGEKRAAMDWKRGDCMFVVVVGWRG